MEQIKYQGYARDRGFNPIQLSSGSVDAIGQQGGALLRQMRENQSAERDTRNAFQSQVEQNQRTESQNRSENYQFEKSSRDMYQQGVLQNQKTQQQSDLVKAQNLETAFGALSGLSKTLANVVLDNKKKRDEENDIKGQNLVFESGITFEDYSKLKADESKLNEADKNVNGVANKLRAQGFSEEYIARLRKSEAKRLGRQRR